MAKCITDSIVYEIYNFGNSLSETDCGYECANYNGGDLNCANEKCCNYQGGTSCKLVEGSSISI